MIYFSLLKGKISFDFDGSKSHGEDFSTMISVNPLDLLPFVESNLAFVKVVISFWFLSFVLFSSAYLEGTLIANQGQVVQALWFQPTGVATRSASEFRAF